MWAQKKDYVFFYLVEVRTIIVVSQQGNVINIILTTQYIFLRR